MAGRKRIDIGTKGQQIVDAALKRGLSSEEIQTELAAVGIRISLRTVKARLAEKRGRMKAERSDAGKRKGPRAESKPTLPLQGSIRQPEPIGAEEIAKAAPATIEEALKIAAVSLRRAGADGNLAEIGRLLRNIGQLQAEQRKAKE